MLLQLPIIPRRIAIIYIMKIETGTSLLYTPTLLRYSKTLSKSEALETLSIELYVIKDLFIQGLI